MRYNRAQAEFWLKDNKKSLFDCNFVLISRPNDPYALSLRSSLQLLPGNKTGACDDYLKSVQYGAQRLQAVDEYCSVKQ